MSENDSIEEKASEVAIQTEDNPKEKQVNVWVSTEQYEQLKNIQAWYRSPSITHALRLIIEDITKGLGTGEYVKMVRGE